MTESADISITNNGNAVTITLGGTLDLTNSQEFHEQIKQASINADSVTVDMRMADFIDTAVVQDLAKAGVTMLKRDKRLKVIASKTRYPLRVLRISGFEEIMDIAVE